MVIWKHVAIRVSEITEIDGDGGDGDDVYNILWVFNEDKTDGI